MMETENKAGINKEGREAALSAGGITRQYFRQGKGTNVFTAVKETNLEIKRGRLVVVMGRSGSGKSTLLNMLAGLLEPTGGRVLLGETDLYAISDEERAKLRNEKMGIIPQGQTSLRSLTVLENVMLPVRLYGSESGENRERAEALLGKVDVAELAGVYPDELSGGERRRLAIARALMMDPEVILADEPTADLDDENTVRILKLLRACADEGRAVFLVTHEADALAYADEVYRMDGGVLTKEQG